MLEPELHDIKLIADARGWLMECVRSDNPWFKNFGQAYVTLCYPGVVKAWHRHVVKVDIFTCVYGMARVVVADGVVSGYWQGGGPLTYTYTGDRPQEFVIGPLNPKVIVIPPGLWHGFSAVGAEPCLILNVPDRVYDPNDEERLPWDAIPFEWKEVSG